MTDEDLFALCCFISNRGFATGKKGGGQMRYGKIGGVHTSRLNLPEFSKNLGIQGAPLLLLWTPEFKVQYYLDMQALCGSCEH